MADAEARSDARISFSASDPDVIAAAQAQLDALHPTESERKVAEIFSKIDSETAHRIALMLRAGQR